MSLELLHEELNEHKAKMKAMRERQEAGQMATVTATVEKHEAAMQVMKETMKALEENQASEMKALIKMDEEEISAAMQAFEIKVVAC